MYTSTKNIEQSMHTEKGDDQNQVRGFSFDLRKQTEIIGAYEPASQNIFLS